MPSAYFHGLVVLLVSAALILAGVGLSRHWRRTRRGSSHSTELSTYVTVIGTLYAVLVAFVLLSVWEQYDTAKDAAEREASQISDLLRLAGGLPEPAATRIKDAVREYATAVVDEEWGRMAVGGRSTRVDKALDALWKLVVGTDPAGDRAVNVHSQALERLSSVSDSRQARLSQARPSVQTVIWVLLIFGGVLTLLSTSFLETSSNIHLPVNAGLTLMIAFMLYLIFAFDHPFSHDVGTGPGAMRVVLESIQR